MLLVQLLWLRRMRPLGSPLQCTFKIHLLSTYISLSSLHLALKGRCLSFSNHPGCSLWHKMLLVTVKTSWRRMVSSQPQVL